MKFRTLDEIINPKTDEPADLYWQMGLIIGVPITTSFALVASTSLLYTSFNQDISATKGPINQEPKSIIEMKNPSDNCPHTITLKSGTDFHSGETMSVFFSDNAADKVCPDIRVIVDDSRNAPGVGGPAPSYPGE